MSLLDAGAFNDATQGQLEEMVALGIVDPKTRALLPPHVMLRTLDRSRIPVARAAVSAPTVLNEAAAYGSAFSRAVLLEVPGYDMLEISGTASVDAAGQTVHVGDFAAQCWRTIRNITELLAGASLTWHHVVRTRCYLRDIERDYAAFNAIRTAWYARVGLVVLPASVGIQAILCRPDLLIEMEATAMCRI